MSCPPNQSASHSHCARHLPRKYAPKVKDRAGLQLSWGECGLAKEKVSHALPRSKAQRSSQRWAPERTCGCASAAFGWSLRPLQVVGFHLPFVQKDIRYIPITETPCHWLACPAEALKSLLTMVTLRMLQVLLVPFVGDRPIPVGWQSGL